jgi:hypothetical protein
MNKRLDTVIAAGLIPMVGTGVVLMDQVGRFLFLNIPLEMLEVDAYKILVSSISVLFIGAATIYTGASLYESRDYSHPLRIVFHIFLAAVLTAPFWMTDVSWNRPISWPSIFFVAFTALVMFGVERWLRREAIVSTQERISGWALTLFFASLLVMSGTVAHGYLAEGDRTTYTFISATNDAVVGRIGSILILKTFDEKRDTFSGQTKLMPVVNVTSLETRQVRER